MMPPPETTLDPSRRQFQMHGCLGRGAYGEVYRATLVTAGGLATSVAVKLLRSDLTSQGEGLRRLHDEARLLAALNHPVILRVQDLITLNGQPALVMELVEGEDLSALYASGLSLPSRAILEVGASLADALAAAWQTRGPTGAPLRLVHRDVKPANVRIGRHGEVRLLDFGVAWSASERSAKTATGVIVGSLPYMSPERFQASEPQAAGDVFAVGCVLFEGLAGEPFHTRAGLQALARLAMDPVAWEAHLGARLAMLPENPPLRALLRDVLAHDPAARPTASELAVRAAGLAEAASTAGLQVWARAHAWPEAVEIEGPLTGERIFETATAPKPQAPLNPPAPPPVPAGVRSLPTPAGAPREGPAAPDTIQLHERAVPTPRINPLEPLDVTGANPALPASMVPPQASPSSRAAAAPTVLHDTGPRRRITTPSAGRPALAPTVIHEPKPRADLVRTVYDPREAPYPTAAPAGPGWQGCLLWAALGAVIVTLGALVGGLGVGLIGWVTAP